MSAGSLIIGDVEIVAILDIDTLMSLGETFDRGDPPPGGTETLGERFPDDFTADSWRFRDHCFLVRTTDGIALIDTGVGSIDSAFGRWLGVSGTLPAQLETIGVSPAEIDHVIFTHVHSDHIGWNTVRTDDGFIPLFSNARYHLHEADVAWARSSEDEDDIREFAEEIAPLEASGQLETMAEEMTLATAHVPPALFGRLVREGGTLRLEPA